MATYDMTSQHTAANLTAEQVHERAESIARNSSMIRDGRLFGWSRSGQGVVEQAIAQLVAEREAAERQQAGVTEVTWRNTGGIWCIEGVNLVAGQEVVAVRRSGETQTVYVDRIIGTTPAGTTLATHTIFKPTN